MSKYLWRIRIAESLELVLKIKKWIQLMISTMIGPSYLEDNKADAPTKNLTTNKNCYHNPEIELRFNILSTTNQRSQSHFYSKQFFSSTCRVKVIRTREFNYIIYVHNFNFTTKIKLKWRKDLLHIHLYCNTHFIEIGTMQTCKWHRR